MVIRDAARSGQEWQKNITPRTRRATHEPGGANALSFYCLNGNLMNKLISACAAAALLTGCASNPDKIAAAYVSPAKYRDYDCKQISEEMGRVGQKTMRLYSGLKKKRKGDNWQMGMGLFLLWPTLFFLEGGDGPEAAEYARLLGEYEAARKIGSDKDCVMVAVSPADVIAGRAEVYTPNTRPAAAERPKP